MSTSKSDGTEFNRNSKKCESRLVEHFLIIPELMSEAIIERRNDSVNGQKEESERVRE